jgi:hypothetical protein
MTAVDPHARCQTGPVCRTCFDEWEATMDPPGTLGPLCAELYVNLVTGVGNQSITATVNLLRRAEAQGKPAHVLYVSDFDPAGENMPTAVARQAQFWADRLGVAAPLTLDPLVLTRGQVDEYHLPRSPIKETDRRGAAFEARNGEGAVELDALEALHPGVLADLVRLAIQPYRDHSLPAKLSTARWDAVHQVDAQWTEDTNGLRGDLRELADDVDAIRDRYEQRLAELAEEREVIRAPFRRRLDELGAELHNAEAPIRPKQAAIEQEYAAELAPHEQRLGELRVEAFRIVDEFAPELPPRPEPDEPDVDCDVLLYDSRRDWLDQLAAFKSRRYSDGGGRG